MEQFDLETSVDLLALSSVSKAQLNQAVNQLGPRSNIGGIIVMSGAGNAHPDITNNARFVRYIWLDNQTPGVVLIKVYQGTYPSDTYADWSTLAIANDSITAAKIADYAVTILNGDDESKIAYKLDGTEDNTKSNYILRLDAAGQYVEVVSASSMFAGLTVALGQINVVGAANASVLRFNSSTGLPEWAILTISTLLADDSISVTKLLYNDSGLANFILAVRDTAPYDVTIVDNNCVTNGNLFPVRSIPLNRLAATAATLNDTLRFDGTNWVKKTPFYGAPTSGGTTVPDPTNGGVLTAPHGLGVIPLDIKAYLECNSADLNYAVGDRIPIDSLSSFVNATSERSSAATLYADATLIGLIFRDMGGADGYRLMNKTAKTLSTDIAFAKWDVKFYAQV